ncbi:MAG: hypothetical protein QOD99_2652 [Chthoniobacter sp.]|jgi:HPt (histidine-containing phosphotransfer) domain-containing protein|nr:hypothetical protein [Chthoniobacter sp.]
MAKTQKSAALPTNTCAPVRLDALPPLVKRLLDAAREEDSLIEDLCRAVRHKDWSTMRRAAHAIAESRGVQTETQ